MGILKRRSKMNKAMILNYDDIDTDIIIPTSFLKVTAKEGLGKYAFYEWRYDSEGNKTNHITNNNEDKSYNILIARNNFGCGSSREHAAWALDDYGFEVIIAASFSDIFYRNWLNNFKIPVILSIEDIDEIIQSKDIDITVNLQDKKLTINNKEYNIDLSEKTHKKLLERIDDIDYTMKYNNDIERYEMKRDFK
jgi:3-isopropylmalate/(R)-2-methylmalate dehydratase small subunit